MSYIESNFIIHAARLLLMNIEAWVLENMELVLWTIEILWVGGVLAIVVLYFSIKWHIRKKKKKNEKLE